jgi:hypothetical protein
VFCSGNATPTHTGIIIDWSNNTDNSGQYMGHIIENVSVYSSPSNTPGNGWLNGCQLNSAIDTTINNLRLCGSGLDGNYTSGSTGLDIVNTAGGLKVSKVKIQGYQYSIHCHNNSYTQQGLHFDDISVNGCQQGVFFDGTYNAHGGMGPIYFTNSEIDIASGADAVAKFAMQIIGGNTILVSNTSLSTTDPEYPSSPSNNLKLDGCLACGFGNIQFFNACQNKIYFTGNTCACSVTGCVWNEPPNSAGTLLIDSGSNYNCFSDFVNNTTGNLIGISDGGTGNRTSRVNG